MLHCSHHGSWCRSTPHLVGPASLMPMFEAVFLLSTVPMHPSIHLSHAFQSFLLCLMLDGCTLLSVGHDVLNSTHVGCPW